MKTYIYIILGICLLVAVLMPFFGNAIATPIMDIRDYLGSFTGPGTGAAQDDNIKASLDLAHTDLDAIIANQENTGTTIAGKTYCSVKVATAVDDDLFDVDGGAILITSMVGVVTTNMQAQANAIELCLDADAGWTDYDFTTAVETNGDAAGTRYVFSGANESVWTPLEGADGGASILMTPWYCGEGMIEQNAAQTTQTGAITWYMTWIPYEDGTTVTAQ